MNFLDDRGRSSLRRHQADREDRLKVRIAGFDHGRQLGRRPEALGRCDGQRAQLAFPHQRDRRRDGDKGHGDASAQQVGDHGSGAAIGHVLDIDVRHRLEQLAGEVLRRADAGRGKAQLARVGARIGDQLLHGLGRHVIGHDENIGRVDRLRDRQQVLGGVVRHFAVETWIDGDLGVGRHQKCVAVGRGLGDAVARDVAAGAGNIFDHHRLAPDLAQPVGHDPGDDVHRTCGRIAKDHSDRAVRISALRNGVAGRRKYRQRGNQYSDYFCYDFHPPIFWIV